MSDGYPRRRTKPLPREELAPVAPAPAVEPETRPALAETRARARAAEDDIVTMIPCPGCGGSKARPCGSCRATGMVEPIRAKAIEAEVTCPLCCGGGRIPSEIASTFDEDMARRKDRA